jgi:uncharacterized protein with ParB-like and HNH nuclease domain
MSNRMIKDLFNGRFFEIPKYQRGFAWERQHIRDLFDDITESIESGSNHYIGTFVLSKDSKDGELFYIVDGQQRITSILLFIHILIKHLKAKDRIYYERFYIKEGKRLRLLPLGRDNKFFSDSLGKGKLIPQNKSQRYLKDAIDEIENLVSNIMDKAGFLKSIEKLEVMEFIEDSEGDAIRIFQTVNDRGKLLSNMEKAKSLLIYFSNRYLNKKYDSTINDHFSDIFEYYDDIKTIGEDYNINLIKSKEFNEDNIMRYHFVSYFDDDYDPTSNYVLNYLKSNLTVLRNVIKSKGSDQIEKFILSYIKDLRDYFKATKGIIERIETETKYYKLFSVLNLSATLYPLITKLDMIGLLDSKLVSPNHPQYTFFDLIEIIDVRVYKTRGTDPKANIGNYVSSLSSKTKPSDIESWLIWFIQNWMADSLFQSNLKSRVYGNRALNYIFIDYCEFLQKRSFTMKELMTITAKTPTVEHILSQKPKFRPKALGFRNKDDVIEHEDKLGNLTILEKGINSALLNKMPLDKITGYSKSVFKMTKVLGSDIHSAKGFTKTDLLNRIDLLTKYCVDRWWS